MDLIDRYVQNVRLFLPWGQQDDIGRELAANLRAEIQDREAEAGRTLNTDEVQAILKRWGHPIAVAGRYQPRQYLIGPPLFPVYVFVLKMVGLIYLVPWLAVWLAMLLLSPAYRAEHHGWAAFEPLGTWWSIVVGVVGVVTVVFAALERTQARTLEHWNPARLPVVRDSNRIPRFSSVVEVVAETVFLLWWIGVIHFVPPRNHGQQLLVTLTAAFDKVFWPVVIQAAVSIGLACLNLFRPVWTLPRALVRLGVNLAVAGIAVVLLQSGPWIAIAFGNPLVPAGPRVVDAGNLGVQLLLIGAVVGSCLVACIEDGRRIYRLLKMVREGRERQ
jgi:hypothetical protein